MDAQITDGDVAYHQVRDENRYQFEHGKPVEMRVYRIQEIDEIAEQHVEEQAHALVVAHQPAAEHRCDGVIVVQVGFNPRELGNAAEEQGEEKRKDKYFKS